MSATASVTRAACFHHPQREAAAKCVACGRSFCRECVTPLERRMYCAGCYKTETTPVLQRKRDWFLISIVFQVLFGVTGLWFTAYFLGKILLRLPSSFHEGTVWNRLVP